VQEVIAFPNTSRADQVTQDARPERLGLGHVLRSTLSVIAHHPLPILTCAVVCFAGAGILGALLYSVLVLDVFFRTGSYFSSTPTIFHFQMQLQAVIGAVLLLFGRGAITWIALHAPRGEPITARRALRAALNQWPGLLVSGLIYGALITLAIIGTTWMLRELRLDVSNYRWLRSDTSSIMNMVVVRTIGLLPPDPGAPFTELYAATRYGLSRMTSSYYGWSTYQLAARNLPPHLLLTGVAGVLLMFLIETLLCMRTAAVMRGPAGSAMGWLWDVLHVSWHHFWTVAAWRWGLRLAIVVLYAGCLTLPMVLHQSLVVPTIVREVRSYWPYPVNTTLYNIGAALAGAAVITFSLIFEARMYVTLSRRGD
jgi:hypothetical protein